MCFFGLLPLCCSFGYSVQSAHNDLAGKKYFFRQPKKMLHAFIYSSLVSGNYVGKGRVCVLLLTCLVMDLLCAFHPLLLLLLLLRLNCLEKPPSGKVVVATPSNNHGIPT